MKPIILLFAYCFTIQGLFGQQVKSFKTSDNETLYYTSIGKGPKIILLYGGPGYSVSAMRPWADSLSNNFECILFDQRGTGLSSNVKLDSTTINIKRAANDLEDLRKHLGGGQLTVCGISWGGALSQIYAAHYPKSVKKIVLVSTLGPDLSLVQAFQDNIRMRRYPNEEDSLKYWSEQPASKLAKLKQTMFFCMPYFYDHSIAKNALIKLLSMCEMNDIMEGLMLTDLAKHYDIKSQLKSYRGECIIVQPRQDVIPSAETSFQIKSILPQAKIFIIEKCGHFPDAERPNELYKILRGVL